MPGLRVAVIDLDVHQGNGTAAIFRDDPTGSRSRCTARRTSRSARETSDLDVELPDGCRDAPTWAALDAAGRTAAGTGRCRASVFYPAGADRTRTTASAA